MITKIMHEHLPTDARIEMWSGRDTGSWTCSCGKTLTWGSRDEIGCLQWHMLACPLAEERKVRKRWVSAIRVAVEKYVSDDAVTDAILACWAVDKNGIYVTQ